MGTFLSSGKVRGSRFLEWVGGSARGRLLAVEVLAARTVDGPIDDNRGRVYASLRLGLSPDLARGRERLARGRARPSRRRGDALLVWSFDGFARDYDVRGR